MSAPLADLLAEELRRHPEVAVQLRELLGLATEVRPSRPLTVGEAASQLGVHPKTLTRAARASRVPGSSRVGRSWRFDPDELALLPPTGITPAPAPPARPRPGTSSAAAAIKGSGR